MQRVCCMSHIPRSVSCAMVSCSRCQRIAQELRNPHSEPPHVIFRYRMAGIYFGGLLKFLYLAEFTLAQSLCHNDIHSKMANPDEQS